MKRDFNILTTESVDLLVCGGGIYGAWTAYDAALRGLKVALVDKGDWASGTSSASSKLIHGGLRYLETFDFKLVKKSLMERQMLLDVAPHRVWPLRFGVPIYQSSRLNRLQMKVGLSLYDYLADQIPQQHKHQYLSTDEFIEHFPKIASTGLKGGFSYLDAQTDDARFVLELVDGAIQHGAICINYCEVTELIEKDGVIVGVKLHDQVDNRQTTIKAKQVVDTTGRWAAQFYGGKQDFRLSKGIHLILPKILEHEALLLTAKSDGRVFFIIPWYGMTLIGTTDSNYNGNPDNLPITDSETNYLLSEANLALKSANWTTNDIVGKFVGVRVLQPSAQDNPGTVSRDWLLYAAPNRLMSSVGGKFTSAREDSAVIVDKVCQRINHSAGCQTFGKPFPWLKGCGYPQLLANANFKAKNLGIDEETTTWLVKRHGTRVMEVLAMCGQQSTLNQKIKPGLPFIYADLMFCAQQEMVVHLDDLLRRRMPLLVLAKLTAQEISQLAKFVAGPLGWRDERLSQELNRCLDYSQPT